MPVYSTFDGPIEICFQYRAFFDRNLFMRMGESLDDFKFGTFIGRFPIDFAASMAAKELSQSICYL